MKMCSSGFAPRRRQGGFIQGAILFALVIIAVVVAAFSLANRDSQNNADTEQARVNASFVLKVGNDIQTAISRAVADGFPPANLNSTGIKFANETSDGTQVNLFDTKLRYAARPQFPPTALASSGTVQPFAGTNITTGAGATASLTQAVITGAGGPDKEAVLLVPGLKEDVCKRINVTANNVLATATLPGGVNDTTSAGWREGCYDGGTSVGYVYYRAVATDVAPAT